LDNGSNIGNQNGESIRINNNKEDEASKIFLFKTLNITQKNIEIRIDNKAPTFPSESNI
jgi:hypothetical protein